MRLKQDLNLEYVRGRGEGQLNLGNQRALRDSGQVFKAKTKSQRGKSVTRPGLKLRISSHKQDRNPVTSVRHNVNTKPAAVVFDIK